MDRIELGEVAELELRERRSAARPESPRDPLARTLAPLEIADDHVNAGPGSSKPLGRGLADARAGTGDDRRAAAQAAGDSALPAQAAQSVADRCVAGRDREVEGTVQGPVERGDHLAGTV